MNTSIRGHGKWGDFLVALIPLSWCCNILINSNFILRMIEWQNESSLFTIRVQGKQWYWVYKYDANTSQAINSTPKNIGHNRWVIFSKNESYHADTYYQAIHLAAQLEFQDSYSGLIEKNETSKKLLTPNTLISDSTILSTNWHTSQQINLSNNDLADFSDNTELFFSNSNTENSSWIYLDLKSTNQSSKESYITQNITLSDNSLTDFNNSIELPLLNNISEQYTLANLNKFFNVDLYNNTIGSNSYYDFLRLDETSDSTGNLRALSSTDRKSTRLNSSH